MARCERGGIVYFRHKFKSGTCSKCGITQVEHHRVLANNRARRKALRHASKKSSSSLQTSK
jgi:hypothetical protein